MKNHWFIRMGKAYIGNELLRKSVHEDSNGRLTVGGVTAKLIANGAGVTEGTARRWMRKAEDLGYVTLSLYRGPEGCPSEMTADGWEALGFMMIAEGVDITQLKLAGEWVVEKRNLTR